MAISAANKEFIDGLIDYYISEAGSYKQIAEQYVPEIESVPDAAFGIITGCVYASFLETYRNQQMQPGLEDITEFNMMLKERAASIKKAIVDPSSVGMSSGGVSHARDGDDGGADGEEEEEEAAMTTKKEEEDQPPEQGSGQPAA